MKVRTRFAPSPTGYLHIGGLRTALFEYLFAKQHNGTMVLRIEDTDRTRFVPGATEALIKTCSRIGISFDEGPTVVDQSGTLAEVGEFGPYIQSKRLEIYKTWADELVHLGAAYPCFCTKEDLEQMRAAQEKGGALSKYDRRCQRLSQEERKARLARGDAHAIRLLVPEGETTFDDLVYGTLRFQNCDIDDQVLLKSDGYPTYHLAVVVDDHLMDITHVLRGEDWLPSTPKQILLYKILGWQAPTFAHLPNLLNPDHKKLSKRQGDVAVEDYLAKGYLPEALINFVGTLGYNPRGDQEIYTLDELVELFDITKVNRSGAIVNFEKLDWLNQHYLQNLSMESLIEAAKPFTKLDLEDATLARALTIEKTRIHRLGEIDAHLEEYAKQPTYEAELLVWKKSDAGDAKAQLSGILAHLESLPEAVFVSVESLTISIGAYISEHALQKGNVLWPLRVALSGKAQSPSPYELLWVFGKIESVRRIQAAIEKLA